MVAVAQVGLLAFNMEKRIITFSKEKQEEEAQLLSFVPKPILQVEA